MSKEDVGADLVAKHPQDFALIDHTAELFGKYAAHGRTNNEIKIVVEEKTDGSPAVYKAPDGSCLIIGVSPNYSEFAKSIGKPQIFDTPEMTAFLMAHEATHCRIGAGDFSGSNGGKIGSERETTVAQGFDALTNESISDSLAVLTVARRDGPDKALSLIDQIRTLRDKPVEDKIHDTRASLDLVAETIKRQPERYASDTAAFSTAVELGAQGAAKTYPGQLTSEDKAVLRSASFASALDAQAERLKEAVKTYREGTLAATPSTIITENLLQRTYEKPGAVAEVFEGIKRSAENARTEKAFGPDAIHDRIKGIQAEMRATQAVNGRQAEPAEMNPYLRGRRGELSASPAKMEMTAPEAKPKAARLGM
jgi:hypothetical protein